MIQELWDYFTTSSSSEARKQGYLYHSIALAHRARRCRPHWHEHLKQCRQHISSCLERRKTGGHLAILGSGLLLETPLDILLPYFDTVDLVDVVHTKDVRNSVSAMREKQRIHFIEADLNKEELKTTYDFVLSANLLSQLPYVIANQWRRGKITSELEEKIQQLTKDLQSRHLQQMRQAAPERILFSDFELNIRSLAGQVLETTATVDKSLDIKWNSSWSWSLAPAPEVSNTYSVELIVGFANF